MAENGINLSRRLEPEINPKHIEKLSLVFISLSECRIKKFREAIFKIKGFDKIIIAEDLPIGDTTYWRSVSFFKEEGIVINISFLSLKAGSSVINNPIAIFADCNVIKTDVEDLVEKISKALIKANQTQGQ